MTKKIIKKSAILIAILMMIGQASSIALPALGAGSASLSFTDVTLRKGCPASIPININTGGESVYAADVYMTVGGSATINSIATGTTLPLQTCDDTTTPDIMLCGARQPGSGAFNGQGVYGTINITPSITGTLSINFDTASSNIINDDILNVLGTGTGANFSVKDRFNVEVDGVGFCTPDTTAPTIGVTPSNGQNNVPLNTSIKLSLSDDRVGVNKSTLTLSVNGKKIDTFSFTESGGTYIPPAPFELGQKVTVDVKVCDKAANCRDYNGSFRTTPPVPAANCGNKVVEEGEECDDGYQTANCDRDCTFVKCGDGIINDVAGEQCDDFNEDEGDGCTSICTLETPVEDLLYCPVLKPAAPAEPTKTLTPEEKEAQLIEEGEADQALVPALEKSFKEADFAESASSSNTEVALREGSKPVVITPATQEAKDILDPCILKYGTEGASLDHDGDGLSDRTECYSATDPNNADTDGDTCFDGEEINRFYTDPLVADCSISDYVEEDVIIIDPKPNWILTSLEVSGSAPRRSVTVGITAFPADQKTLSQVLTQYQMFLDVLGRHVDPANTLAIKQKESDMLDAIAKLQTSIKDALTFTDENPEIYEDLIAELNRALTFLDGGVTTLVDSLEEADNRFKALKAFENKPIFLGEVNELQTVGVGNTTTAGFSLTATKELEDGLYDLVATAGFADGGTKSSAPVRIQLSSTFDVGAPIPQTLDGMPVGFEKIVTNNQRPVLSGKSVYGAMVFATWESLVLESSIIADSAEGSFDVQPPRNLEAGEDHTVTMYAVTETDGGFVRSKSTVVDFVVEKDIQYTIFGTAFYLILLLTLLALIAFMVNDAIEKKRMKEEIKMEKAKRKR